MLVLDCLRQRLVAVNIFCLVDTCPRLRSTERTNAGNAEATKPIRSEAGVALEALVALEAVMDAKIETAESMSELR